MMFRILISCLVVPFAGSCQAQVLKAHFEGLPLGSEVGLVAQFAHQKHIEGTFVIDRNGDLRTDLHLNDPGFYQLVLGDTDRVDIIINPDEPLVELFFTGVPLQEHITVVRSQENKLLWEYKMVSREAQAKLVSSRQQRQILDPRDLAGKARLDSLDRATARDRDGHLERLAQIAPDGYFAKVTSISKALETVVPGDHERVFELVDLADVGMLKSSIYTTAVLTYLRSMPMPSEEAMLAATDSLLRHASPSPICTRYMTLFLLDLFSKYGPDLAMEYLVMQHVTGKVPMDEIPTELVDRIKAIGKVAVGARAPAFKLPVNGQDSITSAEILNGHAFTVLFFYSTTCDHCHNEMPGLRTLWDNIGRERLGIAGIALDDNMPEFENMIAERSIPWPCYTELAAWGSPTAKAFQISATPSYVVIDADGMIVGKPLHWQGILDVIGN